MMGCAMGVRLGTWTHKARPDRGAVNVGRKSAGRERVRAFAGTLAIFHGAHMGGRPRSILNGGEDACDGDGCGRRTVAGNTSPSISPAPSASAS